MTAIPATVVTRYKDGSVLMGNCCNQPWPISGGGFVCGNTKCTKSYRVTVELIVAESQPDLAAAVLEVFYAVPPVALSAVGRLRKAEGGAA